jgi:hypothetical protein
MGKISNPEKKLDPVYVSQPWDRILIMTGYGMFQRQVRSRFGGSEEDVRFTWVNSRDVLGCLLSARTRLMQCSKQHPYFDYLTIARSPIEILV